MDDKTAAIHDSKARLGLADPGFVVYLALNCCIWTVVWQTLTGHLALWPRLVALLASVGPLLLAQGMESVLGRGDRALLYPFHKEGWGRAALHLVICQVVVIGPVYGLVAVLLQRPGQGA